MSAEREWWRRVLAVPVRPRAAFSGLLDEEESDIEARQEPILALILLAGIAGILATPAWHTLMDVPERDWLVVAVFTFIGGGLYGALVFWLGGALVYVASQALGGQGSYRRARHLVAFAAAPVALSLFLVWPLGIAAFGGDLFRSGGSDEDTAGFILNLVDAVFVLWALALAIVGVRTVEEWSLPRAVGATAFAATLFGLLIAAALWA